MASQEHQEAQELATEAALAVRDGMGADARELYARAADLEQKALAQVPEDKARTYGILAVSAASLLYKAMRHEEAEQLLHMLLAKRALAPFARQQLREILEVVLDEQSLPGGFGYSDEIQFVLRGGDIGRGTAPFDLVLQKATEFKGIVHRFTELQGGFPFRRGGAPPADVSKLLQSRATQPGAGSYKFTLRLASPAQMNMLEKPRVQPSAVADIIFAFSRLACSEAPGSNDELRRLVPDDDYRRVALRLLRNVLRNQFTDGSPPPGTAGAPAAARGRWAPRWPRPTEPSTQAVVSRLSLQALAPCSPQPTREA